MFVTSLKKARQKRRCRSRQPLFDLLETRNLLAGDVVDVGIELVAEEAPRPEKPEVSESADGDASVIDDTPVYQTLKVSVLDGTEEMKVPEDGSAIADSQVVMLRSLAGGDAPNGDAKADTVEDLAETDREPVDPVIYTLMSAGVPAEFEIDMEGDPEVVLYTLGGETSECVATEFDAAIDQIPWHNGLNPNDVNGDGFMSPLDALMMINWINERGIGAPEDSMVGLDAAAEAESASAYPDIDGDGLVAPMDVLLLINQLNDPEAVAELPIGDMTMEVADPLTDCFSPANGTRIAMPEDWVEGDEIPGDIFGITVGEFVPSESDSRDQVDQVDEVFKEIGSESDPLSLSDESLAKL